MPSTIDSGPLPSYAAAVAQLAAPKTADCIAWNDAPAGINSFTADDSTPNQVDIFVDVDSDSNRMWISIDIADGATLTIDFVVTPSIVTVFFQFRYALMNCTTFVSYHEESIPASGTFTIPDLPAGEYYLQLEPFAQGQPNITAAVTVSANDTMVVNPIKTQWDDSGTLRDLEACPRLLIPALTEFTDDWYADQAAAQAAIDDETSNCVGYAPDPETYSSFTATDGGSSLSLDGVTGASQPTFTAWGSVNALGGQTLSVAFTVAASAGSTSGMAEIYDVHGNLVETLTGSSPLVSSALPFSGRYTIKVVAATDSPSASLTTANFTITSSGTMTVNPVQALYDVGLECPARLECE